MWTLPYGTTPPIRTFSSIATDMMDEKLYRITRIEGEYAYLRDESGTCDEDLFLAMALLPEGCDEGTRLRCSNFSYEIVE